MKLRCWCCENIVPSFTCEVTDGKAVVAYIPLCDCCGKALLRDDAFRACVVARLKESCSTR